MNTSPAVDRLSRPTPRYGELKSHFAIFATSAGISSSVWSSESVVHLGQRPVNRRIEVSVFVIFAISVWNFLFSRGAGRLIVFAAERSRTKDDDDGKNVASEI